VNHRNLGFSLVFLASNNRIADELQSDQTEKWHQAFQTLIPFVFFLLFVVRPLGTS